MAVTAFIIILGFACTIPFSKQVYRSEPIHPTSDAVQKSDTGFSLLGLIELAEPASANHLFDELLAENSCNKLDNVEIDYYQINFLLFGLPKVRVKADCVQ
jgi:hypothetical protein